MRFVDQVSGNSTTTIPVGTTVHWVWTGSGHSTTSGACPPCAPDNTWNSGVHNSGFTFDHTFSSRGHVPVLLHHPWIPHDRHRHRHALAREGFRFLLGRPERGGFFCQRAAGLRRPNAGRPMRITGFAVLCLALTGAVGAETVTVPAAASVRGLAPFFSDVRAFNTSYTTPLTVTAQYRCFIGSCSSAAQTFTLAPRESRAFDDVCVSLFSSPDSAGAIELSHTGADGVLVVSSRLYSTAPVPTVGMFVPGLPISAARPVTALTSIRNGGPGAGFRTNVGVFNPGENTVTPRFSIYDGGTLVGTAALPAALPPHSGGQINDVFAAAGAGSRRDGECRHRGRQRRHRGASSPTPPSIDNATTDPILVVGAPEYRGSVRTAGDRDLGQGLGLLARRPGLLAPPAFRRNDLPARLPQRGRSRHSQSAARIHGDFRAQSSPRRTTSPPATISSSRRLRHSPFSAARTPSAARRRSAAAIRSSTTG